MSMSLSESSTGQSCQLPARMAMFRCGGASTPDHRQGMCWADRIFSAILPFPSQCFAVCFWGGHDVRLQAFVLCGRLPA